MLGCCRARLGSPFLTRAFFKGLAFRDNAQLPSRQAPGRGKSACGKDSCPRHRSAVAAHRATAKIWPFSDNRVCGRFVSLLHQRRSLPGDHGQALERER
jgi:hypothetical protein